MLRYEMLQKTNLKLNFKLHKFKTMLLKIYLWNMLCSATKLLQKTNLKLNFKLHKFKTALYKVIYGAHCAPLRNVTKNKFKAKF